MPNTRDITDEGTVPTFKLFKPKHGYGHETNGTNAIANQVTDEGSLEDFDMAVDNDESLDILTTSPTARTNFNQQGQVRGQKNSNSSVIEWLFPDGSTKHEEIQDESNIVDDYGRLEQDLKEVPYHYKPFFGNKLINKSKINLLKATEVAQHTLIFHPRVEHDVNFRPDLDINCGEGFDVAATKAATQKNTVYSEEKNSPGKKPMSKRGGTGRTLRGTTHQGTSNSTPRNTNTRSFATTKSKEPRTELEVFWNGTDLLTVLDAESIQRFSTILAAEMLEIDKIKAQMNEQPHQRPSHDPNVLLKHVNTTLDKLSWSQRSFNHGV